MRTIEEVRNEIKQAGPMTCSKKNCEICKQNENLVDKILCTYALEIVEECEKKRIADLKKWRESAGTEEEGEIMNCLINIPSYSLNAIREEMEK